MEICETCAQQFAATRSWQKYCCTACRTNSPGKKIRTRQFQKTRRELINKIKMEKGCARCGYNAHPAALDFNHVLGAKSFAISQDPKTAWQKIKAEIDKCEVLCANCHRIHTYELRHWHTKRKVAP